MRTDREIAKDLGRQLAADGCSWVEVTEVILAAFDGDTPRSMAFREAFANRIRTLRSTEADHVE